MALSPLQLPFAHGEPMVSGILRQQAEFFEVEEVLGFDPCGEGEHVFLWIEKRGLNTAYVAELLAKFAQLSQREVSYSGMKDRNALTRQWFSVHLPGKAELDWSSLNTDQLTVLSHQRHLRKLKRGVHAANHFRIRLTQLQGDTGSLVEKLRVISEQGVPNYFGEQRFGHGGGNVDKAKQWFAGELKPRRPQRSLYLSAVRSHIFNELLAERVTQRHWNKLLTGELLMLEGTHSVFPDSDISNKNSTDLSERLAQGDIHLTGPMAGKVGKLQSSFDVAALEHVVMLANADLCKALEQQGLKAERRALRVMPQNLQWQLLEGEQQGELVVEFSLPSGCFATAVVRECVRYQLADKVNEGDG